MLLTIINAFFETVLMVFISGTLTCLIGLPLGFLLYYSRQNTYFSKLIHQCIIISISLINKTPYLITTIFAIGLLKLITNEYTPTMLAIVPLTIITIPWFSYFTFNSIKNLPPSLSDTAKTLGATPWQSITKIYLPETLPELINGIEQLLIQLLSYSIIAGLFGAKGIGSLIIKKGYESFSINYLLLIAGLFIITTQVIQFTCRRMAKQLG